MPGKLLICLQFPDNPLFTKLYTRSIQRQVQEQLARYFAGLAAVEVTSSHPLIERLGAGDVRSLRVQSDYIAALQTPDKVFVFSLENVDGIYQLHWRQIDGPTQQISTAQSLSTPDRQWVAKAICATVSADFAPVVIVKPDERIQQLGQVRLEFPSPEYQALVQR
jgi:hypothetical protein